MKKNLRKVLALFMALSILFTMLSFDGRIVFAAIDDSVVKLAFENNVTDSSGRGNNGTAYGSPTYVTGQANNAIKFSGVSGQYVTLGTPTDLNLGTSNFSVSFWIKSTGVTGDPVIVSNKNWNSGANTGWEIGLNQAQGNGIEWNFKGATGSRVDMDTGLSITDNRWHHIVVSHNRAGNADFYEDGVLKRSVSISGSTGSIDTGLPTVIGQDGTTTYGSKLSASVDELMIFRHTLTATEVSSLYTSAGGTYETPIFSFSAISDLHCDSSLSSTNCTNFSNALSELNTISTTSSALIIAGDLTQNASDAEYNNYNSILNSNNHPTVYPIMGNHDVRWLTGGYTEALNRFKAKTGMSSAYYDAWISGYHFIFLSTEQDLKDQAYLSTTQLNWLSSKLSENAITNKPIFVFLHQSLVNTTAGSYPADGYNQQFADGVVQDSQLRNILNGYPQSLFITGHTHAVSEDPISVLGVTGVTTCANTASVAYTIVSNGYGYANDSQGLIIDVYSNRVDIKGRNFSRDYWSRIWALDYVQIPPSTPIPTPTITPTPSPSPTPTPSPGYAVSGTKFGTTPAYASGYEYDKATDGLPNTFFDFSAANGGYTGWDLGAGNAKAINKARYFPRSGYASRMTGGKFQGSNTSSSSGYVDLATISSVTDNQWNEMTVTDATAYRYLRYLSPDGGYCNVAEVEFITPLSESNLSQGQTVTYDSQQSGNEASKAVDGNTGTRWCANDGNTGHWIRVDLGASKTVRRVKTIWELNNKNYKYKLEYSTNGTSWTMYKDNQNTTSSVQTRDDYATATARYIRVTVTGLPSGTWASISELQVFGQ